MAIPYTYEMYRRVDGDGFLARFWTVGSNVSMIATGETEEIVLAKVEEHYRASEEEIRRQNGLTAQRLANMAAARLARKAAAEGDA